MSSVAAPVLMKVGIALPVPLPEIYTYTVPPELEARVKAGVRVRVSFRNREAVGYLVKTEMAETDKKLKPILEILDDDPVLSPAILKLTDQISRYYGSSWGDAIENALPQWVKYGKKADKALKALEESAGAECREPSGPVYELTPEQKHAWELIQAAFSMQHRKPLLLHGVTGSGKSELYIRALRHVLGQGKSAICLVPEIALTEQLKRFFADQFGEKLEILHSKLSNGERFLAWKRLEKGMTRLVLGPRSAVFAPVPNLGLIIMDEEHEHSYKQETVPRYHAREIAAWRAENEKALFIMGTATPSLEAMQRAETGVFSRIVMAKRVDDKKLPDVLVVDLKEEMATMKRNVILSHHLEREIEKNLKAGEGTLLLLNRRGFSTHVQCPGCGNAETCPSCQVALTHHQEKDVLLCHYCNYQRAADRPCSQCGQPVLQFRGFGTEKVESEVARRFPTARLLRLDADTVQKKGSHEVILKDFRDQKADILIGTQMIAKGFDFPHVTLVGVILADVGLMLPDFRSAEKTFQLLTQVAGRAGRGRKPGRVIIQTFSPKHPSVDFSRTHDYLSFFQHEAKERQSLSYPPFCKLVNVIVRGKDEKKTAQFARDLKETLCAAHPGLSRAILGPAPLPFYKLRGHFRWHVMMKCGLGEDLVPTVLQALSKIKKPSAVAVAVDVDPLNIL
ncbi:MAG TPA: primosomal protein N' [Verrucomicrobiae bacterium]|jgi:primosomal protein N' (replication factor Y)|nr:primosomal protein N' [Verrucomicrobiae bacterium]